MTSLSQNYYNLNNWSENTWNPTFALSGGGSPFFQGLSANGTRLYAYGRFTSVNGSSRQGIAAFDMGQNNRPLLSLNVNLGYGTNTADLQSVLDDGEKIYLMGRFSSVNGQARNSKAALNRSTFALTDWAAGKNSTTYILLPYSFLYGNKILTPYSFDFHMIDRVTADVTGSGPTQIFNTRNIRSFEEVDGNLIVYTYPVSTDGLVSGKYVNRGFFIIPAEDLAALR